MKVILWGTRGSLASPGPDTVRYGGNTSCVSVEGQEDTLLVLDAGTGIRNLGQHVAPGYKQVHILLSHLHMDHVQGLPFFSPLRDPDVEVHIWGPPSTTHSLSARLLRYLSPPLFPVSVRDLSTALHFHETLPGKFEIGEFSIDTGLVLHPNTTMGYRISNDSTSIAYLPDHEPALGARQFPRSKEWTSGYNLAAGADLLIHDAQYTTAEYEARVGFGHSSFRQAFRFAELAGVGQFVPFHHDPEHSDNMLDHMFAQMVAEIQPACVVMPGKEGMAFNLGHGGIHNGKNAR